VVNKNNPPVSNVRELFNPSLDERKIVASVIEEKFDL
jgi:hypothetical protein